MNDHDDRDRERGRAMLVLVPLLCLSGARAARAQSEPPLIERIELRGNRQVDGDAIRAALTTAPGAPLDRQRLREDVRALWRLGAFDGIAVEVALEPGLVVTFVVEERPTIRRIVLSGTRQIGLDDLNQVLDLRRAALLDLTAVRRNVEKVRAHYLDKGFYLAEVDFQIRPAGEGQVDVWLLVREHTRVVVRRVDFAGNHAVADERLRALLSTRPGGFLGFLGGGGTFKAADLERDLSLIQAYYLDQGHVEIKVGAPRIALSADKRSLFITIPVDEGPVYAIGTLAFKGDDAAGTLAKLKSRPGETFSRSKLGLDLRNLLAFYQDQGYAFADVSPLTDMDAATRRVNVTFAVERGARVYVERIRIRGNSRTRDKVIRRELKLTEGQLYSGTDLEISRARVQALGYFESVAVSTKRGSSAELIEVLLDVVERPTGTFQIGAGFSSAETFVGQIQISENNLFGRGQSLSLQAQLSLTRHLFQLRFVEPAFLDTGWTFAFELYNQTRLQGSFTRTSTGGSLTWGLPLSYETRFFLTYRLEEVTVGGASPVANLFRGGRLSSLRASLSYDARDNRLFPTRGLYGSVSLEVADRLLGSETTFVRAAALGRYYRPLVGPLVLKLRAEVGLVTSRDPEGVAISERYLVGGIDDVRGFDPQSLGPRLAVQRAGAPEALLGQTLGGNLEVVLNAEVELPILKKLGLSGVVFFDAGNAFNLEDRYCSRDGLGVSPKVDPCFRPGSLLRGLRTSVGAGVRWLSPVGPLRFECGVALDRQAGEAAHRCDFSIGTL